MSAPENPPAFPEVPADSNAYEGRSGMSLRDWFAGQALAGICAHVDTWGLATAEKMAAAAYEHADAMLTERAKRESGR